MKALSITIGVVGIIMAFISVIVQYSADKRKYAHKPYKRRELLKTSKTLGIISFIFIAAAFAYLIFWFINLCLAPIS